MTEILILLGIFFVWNLLLTAVLFYSKYKPSFLTKKRDRRSILQKNDFRLSEEHFKSLGKQIEQVEGKLLKQIQHVGLIRFNPFNDVGSDQSFSLALLDGQLNGIVISSLHSRSTTRIYAKPIVEGKSLRHDLSNEEKRAIAQALKQELTSLS